MTKYYKYGQNIVKTLLDLGYQAFFVGGFVRDYLLGIDVSDIDITTNATPNEVEKIFKETKATGVKFGTITVFLRGYQYEVTTFRTEGKYINYRKPENVSFAKSLEEDLKRRDFTINGLAMDISNKIIDLFNGKEDLDNRIIRSIGNPDIRFKEDALRILRAFRFVSKLGFNIEENTLISIKKNMNLLTKIPIERVMIEIKKIFSNFNYIKTISLMNEANIEQAFPELKKGINLLSSMDNYSLSYLEFFSLCFYLNKKGIPEKWRFSNKELSIINNIIELINLVKNNKFNEEIIYRFGMDISLSANNILRIFDSSKNQEKEIINIYKKLPIYGKNDLVFKGRDILKITSFSNLETIGSIIDDLEKQVVTGKLPNHYSSLKKYVLDLLETKYGKR